MNHSIDELPKDVAFDVFSHFTRHTEQAIFIVDLQRSIILYVNPAFQELWDVKQQNGNEAFDYIIKTIHDEDREHIIEESKKYINGNKLKNLEFRIKSAEGIIKWICLTLYTKDDEGGKRLILTGFAEDVTRRKDYELYLFKHNSKKNSILSILSHDLRGPLSNISMISSLLQKEHQKGAFNDAKKLIDMIQKTCTLALDLITQYVSKELLESSTIEIKKTRTEIVQRTLSIIDMLEASHEQLNRNIKLEAHPNVIWVEVDDVKILQIINNLISNAIKFTNAGGSIYIKLEDKENHLLITLQDDGIGIPEKLQPYLFDEFTRARRKGLRGEDTVGLGMSITKKMIELHGGEIWFESKEGEGTTFFINLPKS